MTGRSGILEDFTTYVEVDPNNHIERTSSRVTAAGLTRPESAYVYSDKGAGHFDGDFDHKLDCRLTSAVENSWMFIWSLKVAIGDYADAVGSPKNYIALNVGYWLDGGLTYKIRVVGSYNGEADKADYWTGMALDTTYYLRIKRSGNVVTVGIYGSAANRDDETSPLDTLSIALGGVSSLRYIYAIHSFTLAGNDYPTSGYVENLDLQERWQTFAENLSVLSTVPTRIYGGVRPIRFNLSAISVRLVSIRAFLRKLRQDLSVIRDVFSFVYTPVVIPVYKFVQDLSVIGVVPKRIASYTRRQVQETVIRDVLRRVLGVPRAFRQDLSTISVRLVRRVSYSRKLIQTTVMGALFKRRIAYLRRLRQDLSIIGDVFSSIYVKFVRVYRLIQTLVISERFQRRVSLTRRVREDLSVLRVRFSSVFVHLVRVYRLVQNLSVIGDVFSSVVVTPAIEVLRRKVTGMQAEIADLYEKVKKKAEFYLGK